MRQMVKTLEVRTEGQGFYDITGSVGTWTTQQPIVTGLLTVWCRHTSASLIVQENADPDVRADLLDFFRRIAPESAAYRHDSEGPDDMPAHIRAAMSQPGLSIPVRNGRPELGTWQAIYLFEHRAKPHIRLLTLHLLGE
jgi:secondary thiamine-phosphate synthase enzyme